MADKESKVVIGLMIPGQIHIESSYIKIQME